MSINLNSVNFQVQKDYLLEVGDRDNGLTLDGGGVTGGGSGGGVTGGGSGGGVTGGGSTGGNNTSGGNISNNPNLTLKPGSDFSLPTDDTTGTVPNWKGDIFDADKTVVPGGNVNMDLDLTKKDWFGNSSHGGTSNEGLLDELYKNTQADKNPFSLANMVKFFEEMTAAAGSLEALFDQIDANDDSVILRPEFEQFLKDNTPTGTTYSVDLLNDFWDVLDINQSHKKIANTNLKNLNAVTLDEMATMDAVVEKQQQVETFIEGLQAPSNLTDATVKAAWLYEMGNAINKSFFETIKKGGAIDLNSLYKQLFEEITPKYVVADMQVLNSALLSQYDYNLNQDFDGILGKNIDNNLTMFLSRNPNATDEEIVDIIQELIANFVATADLTAQLPSMANGLNSGYELSEIALPKFSELQKAVMNCSLKNDEKAVSALTEFPKSTQPTLLENFYSNYYTTSFGNDFTTINTNVPSAFLDYIMNILGYSKDVPNNNNTPVSGSNEGKGENVSNDDNVLPGENDKEDVVDYKYDHRLILTHYSVQKNQSHTINDTIKATRNGIEYSNFTIEPESRLNISSFEQNGTNFTLISTKITAITTINLRVIDNENDALMFTIPIKLDPTFNSNTSNPDLEIYLPKKEFPDKDPIDNDNGFEQPSLVPDEKQPVIYTPDVEPDDNTGLDDGDTTPPTTPTQTPTQIPTKTPDVNPSEDEIPNVEPDDNAGLDDGDTTPPTTPIETPDDNSSENETPDEDPVDNGNDNDITTPIITTIPGLKLPDDEEDTVVAPPVTGGGNLNPSITPEKPTLGGDNLINPFIGNLDDSLKLTI